MFFKLHFRSSPRSIRHVAYCYSSLLYFLLVYYRVSIFPIKLRCWSIVEFSQDAREDSVEIERDRAVKTHLHIVLILVLQQRCSLRLKRTTMNNKQYIYNIRLSFVSCVQRYVDKNFHCTTSIQVSAKESTTSGGAVSWVETLSYCVSPRRHARRRVDLSSTSKAV